MREIKFRAWNLLGECWDYFTLQGLAIDKEIIWKHYKIWCEYTGLLDKKGKEIYEGDIIQWDWKILTKVKYIGNKFSLGNWYEDDYPNTKEKCKIIGNIYENPKLLE